MFYIEIKIFDKFDFKPVWEFEKNIWTQDDYFICWSIEVLFLVKYRLLTLIRRVEGFECIFELIVIETEYKISSKWFIFIRMIMNLINAFLIKFLKLEDQFEDNSNHWDGY